MVSAYSPFINFKTDGSIDETIRSSFIYCLADRVSNVYATCLTLEWHKTRPLIPGIEFQLPNVFPSSAIVEGFRINLRNTIIKELSKKDEYFDSISLSVDCAPESLLRDILYKSCISHHHYPLHLFFPEKSHTNISVRSNRICLSSNVLDRETIKTISDIWNRLQTKPSPTTASTSSTGEATSSSSSSSSSSSFSSSSSSSILEERKEAAKTERRT